MVRAIDELVRLIDAQREALGLSKAELARSARLAARGCAPLVHHALAASHRFDSRRAGQGPRTRPGR